MNRWVGLGLLFITIGALVLRVPRLDLRPLHNDEAVNAVKLLGLWETGRYQYDPNEHHGPSLYYSALPFVQFSGAPDSDHLTDGSLRAVAVFYGVLLILLLALVADGLGPVAVLSAAVLTAISPAMVFYSRYFIHEMPLIVFSLMLLGGGWKYSQTRSLQWAVLAGAGAGLMYATKETFVFTIVAMTGAAALTYLCNRWCFKAPLSTWKVNWKHIGAAAGAGALVSVVLFTSFFTNANGPLDSIKTYLPWLKRAGGASPHIHPWFFYLERLAWFKEAKGPVWSEGLILVLAGIGTIAAFARRSLPGPRAGFARFLVFFTMLLTAAYSVIAYKTPWCMLGFLLGMILLAGVGTAALFEWCRPKLLKGVVLLVLLLAAAHLTWEAWRASYVFASDRRNPYVYAQTVPDVLNLVRKVQEIAKIHPDRQETLVKVIASDSDYWPLPWYLRQLKRVGWWDRLPADPYAPIMIVSANLHAALDEKSDKAWLMVGYFELRPSTFLELYVQFSLWEKYVQSLPRAVEE